MEMHTAKSNFIADNEFVAYCLNIDSAKFIKWIEDEKVKNKHKKITELRFVIDKEIFDFTLDQITIALKSIKNT